MARTAVVAGTARSVSERVGARHRVAGKAAHPPGKLTDELVDQLKKLAELRDAGVLTEKEFAAKKNKLLP
jgi:hypothetical protein